MKKHLLSLLFPSLLFLFSMPAYFGCKYSEAKKVTTLHTASVEQQTPDTLYITSEPPVFYAQTKDLASLAKGNIHKLVLSILLTKENLQLYFWRSSNNSGRVTYDDKVSLVNAGFTKHLDGIKDEPLLLDNLELTKADIKQWQAFINKPENTNKYLVFEPQLQSLGKDGIKANAIVYTIRDLDHKPTPADIPPPDAKSLSTANPSPPRGSY